MFGIFSGVKLESLSPSLKELLSLYSDASGLNTNNGGYQMRVAYTFSNNQERAVLNNLADSILSLVKASNVDGLVSTPQLKYITTALLSGDIDNLRAREKWGKLDIRDRETYIRVSYTRDMIYGVLSQTLHFLSGGTGKVSLHNN